MPSGNTHDRITLWLLPWIVGGTYLLAKDGELTLIVAGGFLFGGLMFGPDLDIYSIQYKRWGVLRYIWLPYRRLLRHRSFFSHGLIVGTIIRIVYLLLVVSLLAIFIIAIAQLVWGFNWNWQQFVLETLAVLKTKYFKETVALFAGLELGSLSHSLSDWLGSYYKKQRQKRQKHKKTVSRKK
ncbi:metal-binding protein [Myxosarcina sp. GI1]|uniref:metal-binding protein n=1 Tax=Myxosarcina sp. GI1 TaxID=1541065 RepID=UPI00055A5594|nr:metal-binding protein [Myxosarcina sp. GI1]